MNKYVRVMDGLKSNAGGFNYKIDEVNVSDNCLSYIIIHLFKKIKGFEKIWLKK